MWAACAFLLTVTTVPAEGDYLMVFSAESIPYAPTRAHTFAAVVRVGRGADGALRVVDIHSLSWLPAAGVIRPFALRGEKGRNVPLDETLRDAVAQGREICVWGPYLMRGEFADMFRDRVALVESSFRYKAASLVAPLHVADCTRSVEELVGRRRYIGVCGYGAASASYVVRQFEPWMIDPCHSHPWVATLIGLDDYPLVHRPHGDFTSRKDRLFPTIRR